MMLPRPTRPPGRGCIGALKALGPEKVHEQKHEDEEEQGPEEDAQITCRICEAPFTYSAGEQRVSKRKGFGKPTRCSDCKAAKKERFSKSQRPPSWF
ncbi:hypothetical protein T484DRAFT_1979530 [Baffinella frigidus]|nr:hypothetical protein T484DRAFT_1979530 [Cryptophyta sp. CCMP2293]